MNKVYVSNVVSRYSNKVVKDVSSILPKGQTSSFSGLDGIVEDEPPAAATGRVNAFFEACSQIKVSEGRGTQVRLVRTRSSVQVSKEKREKIK